MARVFKAMRQRVAGPAGAVGAGDSPTRPAQRRAANRRRICCSAATRRRVMSWMPWVFMFVALGFGSSPGTLQGLQEAFAAVSTITHAAGTVLNAGANASVAVSSVAIDVLVTSVSVVDEIWRGVHILNVSLHRSAGKAVALSAADLSMHLLTQGQIPQHAQSALVRCLANASAAIPIMMRQDDHFNVNGEYTVWWLAARMRSDNSLAAAYWVINVSFEAQWANPAWDVLGFRIDTESGRIVEGLSRVFARLPELPETVLAIDEAALAAEFGASGLSPNTQRRFLDRAAIFGGLLSLSAGFAMLAQCRRSPVVDPGWVEQPVDELGFEQVLPLAASQEAEFVELECSSAAGGDEAVLVRAI